MKNQKFRKMLAIMLAASMILGMGVTAFADGSGDASGDAGSGGTTGTGTFEGHVDQEKLEVTLPTDTSGTMFNYKMDPEGLIAATEAAKYPDTSFEEGKNVFFQSADDTWTAESAKLKVMNTGTVAADVTVKAQTADNAQVAMADSATFAANDKAAKLYLGLKAATKEVAVKSATDGGATVVLGLSGNADNYEIKSGASGYEFAKKTGVQDSQWNSFEFSLTGACNPNGDYSASGLAASNVTLTWSYKKRADGSSAELLAANAVSGPQVSITSAGLITVSNLTADNNFKDMTITDKTGQVMKWNIAPTTWGTDNWTAENGGTFTLQLSDQWVDYLIKQGGTAKVIVILADGTTTIESAVVNISK